MENLDNKRTNEHKHKDLLTAWMEDTTQEFETLVDSGFASCDIKSVYVDKMGKYIFRLKPKVDEYAHLQEAIKEGKQIELQTTGGIWVFLLSPCFSLPVINYRIYDPYRELKEAEAQGKRIVWQNPNGDWEDVFAGGEYYDNIERYRIVPYDIDEHADIITSPSFGKDNIVIRLTKSGIDGRITAKIVE